MLLQGNKKGVSEIIGYMLLVVFGIIIGAVVFVWLRSYAPTEALNCPDGTSILMKGLSYNNTTLQLSLTSKNNGKFDIAGYFIHASNSSNQTLETIDLSNYLNESYGGKKLGNAVLFSSDGANPNSLSPGNEKTNIFDIPAEIGTPYSITVIPTRYQVDSNNRQRFVSCSNAVVNQIITAPGICTPNCSGKVCGSDGCSGSCGSCQIGSSCDVAGQCYSNSCTPSADPCGTQQCGTAANGTCGQVNCPVGTSGTCQVGFSCQVGQCISNCGNGVVDAGESCDTGNLNGQSCTTLGYTGGNLSCYPAGNPLQCQFNYSQCTGGSSGTGCDSYCTTHGYTHSTCVSNNGNCNSAGGTHQSGGDSLCTAPGLGLCCCFH